MRRGGERRQFRALVKLFAYRFFDTDILSVRGDVTVLFAQLGALLAAVSLVLLMVTGPKYAGLYQHLTRPQLRIAAWGDQEFLISTSMAIIGVFTLLLWDALFPDRRDCLILGAMPVRIRSVVGAKLTALGAAIGLAVLGVNSFTGLACPFLIVPGASGVLETARNFAAFWVVIPLASVFVFLLLVGVQGVALHILPHDGFLRWSSFIQMGAFFAVLTVYFLTPPLANPGALASPDSRLWYELVPSYWFFGLFQVMIGSTNAVTAWLARRALAGSAIAAVVAAAVYLPAFSRQMRRTVAQAGIAPPRHSFGLWTVIAGAMARSGRERGILTFIVRTLARSRQHRLLLAIYSGMGMAYVFSQAAYLLYRARDTDYGIAESRIQTALGMPLIAICFLVIGLRVSFSIPIELRANWLFRMTDPLRGGAYLRATRKVLLMVAVVPVLAVAAPVYLALWPWQRALEHCAFVAAFGLLAVDLAIGNFAKVPFTCSYLPGKANLKIRLGVYWGLLIIGAEVVTDLESRALGRMAGYGLLMAATLAAWGWVAWRGRGNRAEIGSLSFEEQPDFLVADLGLRP